MPVLPGSAAFVLGAAALAALSWAPAWAREPAETDDVAAEAAVEQSLRAPSELSGSEPALRAALGMDDEPGEAETAGAVVRPRWAGAQGAPDRHPAPAPADDDDDDATAAPGDLLALRARIADIVAGTDGAGAAVAVIAADGSRLIEGYGPARPGVAMDSGSLFRVGSLSKTVMSLVVMRLVEQGRLRLEDRVRALLPEIAIDNPWEATHPLQVAHLLEHTAGFDEMRFNEIFDPARGEDRPLRQVLARNPRSRVARWPPGTRHAYSQPGYTTVAYLVEKLTGRRYEQVLQDEVFGPLGMPSASFRLTPAARQRLADGRDDGHPIPYVHLLHRPALNLMLSARDVSRLILLFLGRGTIEGRQYLAPASIDRIERSGTLPYGPQVVRYGLGNWGDVGGPFPTRGHGGFLPGYLSHYRYSRPLNIGFAVFTNDPGHGRIDAITGAIQRFLMARTGGPAPAPTLPAPVRPLASYTGTYRLTSPSVEFTRYRSDVYGGIRVAERAGVLWLERRDRAPVPLVPSGPDQFRLPPQSGSSIQFTETAPGRRAVVVGQGYYEQEWAVWAWFRRELLEMAVFLLFTTLLVPVLVAVRSEPEEARLLVRPFLALLCLWGLNLAFDRARWQGTLGHFTPTTAAIWVLTWALALVSYASFAALVNATARRGPAHVVIKAYAVLTSAAAVWITLHLSRYDLIGLRTWRW